jgi:hypothetical protein
MLAHWKSLPPIPLSSPLPPALFFSPLTQESWPYFSAIPSLIALRLLKNG